MYLIRMGWRTVNLEYLIETADSALGAPASEVSPGMIRASIYPGRVFEVGGDDAARLRLHIEENLTPTPGPKPREPDRQGRPKASGTREITRSSSKPRQE